MSNEKCAPQMHQMRWIEMADLRRKVTLLDAVDVKTGSFFNIFVKTQRPENYQNLKTQPIFSEKLSNNKSNLKENLLLLHLHKNTKQCAICIF